MMNMEFAGTIADSVISNLEEDGGYSKDEMVAGLAQAIIDLTVEDDDLANEAIDFISRGSQI